MILQAKLRIFGFLLLLGILGMYPLLAQAITNIQVNITGAGYNNQGCTIWYEIAGNGDRNDSNSPEMFDYYGVIEWVHFPTGTVAVSASIQTAVKGQAFVYTSELNLIGNYEHHPLTLTVYELRTRPSRPSTGLTQLVNYILGRSFGELASINVLPTNYFSEGDCPPY